MSVTKLVSQSPNHVTTTPPKWLDGLSRKLRNFPAYLFFFRDVNLFKQTHTHTHNFKV